MRECGTWVAPESQKEVEEGVFFFFFFLIPEIEKERNQTSEVIFGIGKKDVVVILEEIGICTSLGMKPVGQ